MYLIYSALKLILGQACKVHQECRDQRKYDLTQEKVDYIFQYPDLVLALQIELEMALNRDLDCVDLE